MFLPLPIQAQKNSGPDITFFSNSGDFGKPVNFSGSDLYLCH